ncbi:hypothetical protein [Haliangium ochraceum]|uniref:hypothetical protein n=1 Tax=Haliangium ochraceum TaxID=80816 RepID=UPI0002DBB82B|nr:hypothetical protein [Haliangium ochraceum]
MLRAVPVSIVLAAGALACVAGCVTTMPPAAGPQSSERYTAGPHSAYPASQSSPSEGPSCVVGETLAPSMREAWTQQWQAVAAVHQAGASQPSASASWACATLDAFVYDCPAWDSRAAAWQVDACALALREDIAVGRARADALLRGPDSGAMRAQIVGEAVDEPWIDAEAPAQVRRSLARLQALPAAAAAHPALIAEARALIADAQAIGDAYLMIDSTDASCGGLRVLSEHALQANRYAAAILGRALAARRDAALAATWKEFGRVLARAYAGSAAGAPQQPGEAADWLGVLASRAACYDADAAAVMQRAATGLRQRAAAAASPDPGQSSGFAPAPPPAPAAAPVPVPATNPADAASAPPAQAAPPAPADGKRLEDAPGASWLEVSDSGGYCCRVCSRGKACGDSCIARNRTCRRGPGCACDG